MHVRSSTGAESRRWRWRPSSSASSCSSSLFEVVDLNTCCASTMKREEHSLFSSLMMTTSSLLLVHLYNYRYIYNSSTTAHNPFIGGDAWHIIVGAPLPSRKNEGLCWGSSDVDRILLRSCLHFLRLGTKKVHQSSVFLSSKFSFSYYFGTSTLHNIPSLLSELI